MASSPQWKIYDAHGTYQAACKEIEAAAALMGFYGDGAMIRQNHGGCVWHEGQETLRAGESYDEMAAIVAARLTR